MRMPRNARRGDTDNGWRWLLLADVTVGRKVVRERARPPTDPVDQAGARARPAYAPCADGDLPLAKELLLRRICVENGASGQPFREPPDEVRCRCRLVLVQTLVDNGAVRSHPARQRTVEPGARRPPLVDAPHRPRVEQRRFAPQHLGNLRLERGALEVRVSITNSGDELRLGAQVNEPRNLIRCHAPSVAPARSDRLAWWRDPRRSQSRTAVAERLVRLSRSTRIRIASGFTFVRADPPSSPQTLHL